MAQSLIDLKKAKRIREKRAQRRAQAASDNKQDKDRERFRKQAKAETAAAYTTSNLSPTNKAIHLEKERKATKKRGKEFAKWQMESEKLEKIRAQTAATAAKKLSAKESEREHSRLRLAADRATSQKNRQQKQQQHSIPPPIQCQELQQNNEQQTQRNQVIHQ